MQTLQRIVVALVATLLVCSSTAAAQAPAFTVNANVALSSLIAITDGHLQSMANSLETLAATHAAKSAQWNRISGPLARVAQTNVPAVLFFATPNGSDWTLHSGLQKSSISDRPYFRAVMSGAISIGDLIVSRSTARAATVVAVPIVASNGKVVGLLGASVFLDSLSALIDKEMGLGPNDLFWAIDGHGIIAIHSDTSAIFVDPSKASAELKRVTTTMLAHASGTQTYTFRGRTRTVIYQASKLTHWHYGFGVLH